jgi:putative FmdB family regulatory protein
MGPPVPTYQYSCTECGHFLEAVQKFTDDALTVCPECGGKLRKVFNAVGVVFKGSGFYRTDSRSGSAEKSGEKSAEKSSADKGEKSSTNSSNGTAAKQPAAAGSGSSAGSTTAAG